MFGRSKFVMITFSDNIVDEEKSEIAQILPQWESYVLHSQRSADGVPEMESLHFLVAAKSRDEFRQWLSQYEEKSKTRYTVWTSRTAAGKRVVMSQTLVCQHKTHLERTYDPAFHKVTKNTNCPSKITVTIHAVHDEKYRYRGKFAEIAKFHRLMPCEVKLILNHNHNIGNGALLRFGQPCAEVQETLKSLFQEGHSPASALQCIKRDIQLNYSDYPLVLGDRRKCPDYNYCHYLYTKLFKKKYGPMSFDKEGKEFLQQRLPEYNSEVGSVYAKMVMKDTDYMGNTGKLCKHIDWANTVCQSQKNETAIDNAGIGSKHYFIAIGEQPPENWLEPLYVSQTGIALEDAVDLEQMDAEEQTKDTGSLTATEVEDADHLEKMEIQERNQETEEEISDSVHMGNLALKINNDLLARAVSHLTELSNRSPDEMRKGLEALCEVEKMKTPSACTSLLLKLREGNSRKNEGNYIPVQATAINRRKKKLVGRRSNLGGKPRTASASVSTTLNSEGCGMSQNIN